MAAPIRFGTDGWRGVIADDFTFDNVRVCAQSVADYLNGAGLAPRGLIVGYDTRFASEDFAAAAAEVAAANGIRVHLCQ
ncbi:MAG: phosphoglucomutase/phosphomannomutase family protein, partial [Dehalococcoidia bacterium]|nr:phosphoglucomutase/phosphomannomutase family protein [Dehalococcoidia bacterium]